MSAAIALKDLRRALTRLHGGWAIRGLFSGVWPPLYSNQKAP
jgi:hypothetical protein